MSNLAVEMINGFPEMPECSEPLKNVWNGTYVWIGQFTKGVDNRIVFARLVDRIITTKMTMGERYTTIKDFVAYYRFITGDEPEHLQVERLNAWARGNYDPRDYPVLSEKELNRRSRKFEKPLTALDELPREWRMNGKRRAGMVVFSLDIAHKLKATDEE